MKKSVFTGFGIINLNTRMSQKFCNILVRVSLGRMNYGIEAVQAVVGTNWSC